jgi:hypothetical protein
MASGGSKGWFLSAERVGWPDGTHAQREAAQAIKDSTATARRTMAPNVISRRWNCSSCASDPRIAFRRRRVGSGQTVYADAISEDGLEDLGLVEHLHASLVVPLHADEADRHGQQSPRLF